MPGRGARLVEGGAVAGTLEAGPELAPVQDAGHVRADRRESAHLVAVSDQVALESTAAEANRGCLRHLAQGHDRLPGPLPATLVEDQVGRRRRRTGLGQAVDANRGQNARRNTAEPAEDDRPTAETAGRATARSPLAHPAVDRALHSMEELLGGQARAWLGSAKHCRRLPGAERVLIRQRRPFRPLIVQQVLDVAV